MFVVTCTDHGNGGAICSVPITFTNSKMKIFMMAYDAKTYSEWGCMYICIGV